MDANRMHMIRRWTILCALVSLSSAAEVNGKDLGIANKVDAIFAEFDKPESPGCALGVIQRGSLVYARGYGSGNLEHKIANHPSLVYDIGSTSKQFTAFSVLLLAEEGKLSLDDDVRKYIPDLPAYQNPITIRHLIHHTSGLRDYPALFALAGVHFGNVVTERDTLELIVRQKAINFSPGTEFRYSNTGYFLLSLVVKEVSGKSLAQFANERIFEPLGMKHTLISDNHRRIVPRRATGYWPTDDGRFEIDMSNFEPTGDGAVLTTIEDLVRWDRNFYKPVVGSAATLEEMHSVGRLSDGTELDYAAGLDIGTHRGLRLVSHSGGWAGYRSDLLRFPDQELSVACLCNLGIVDARSLGLRVADLYLGGTALDTKTAVMSNRKAVDVPTEALMGRAGIFRSTVTGEVYRVSIDNGSVRISLLADMQSRALEPIGKARFATTTRPRLMLEFKPDVSGEVLYMTRGDQAAEKLERVPSFMPNRVQLNEFVGRYYSEELDAIYEVGVAEEHLYFAAPDRSRRPLSPTIQGAFIGEEGQHLQFDRTVEGGISGFSLSFGRITDLHFSRQ